jgi:hypothetical protein
MDERTVTLSYGPVLRFETAEQAAAYRRGLERHAAEANEAFLDALRRELADFAPRSK